MMNRTVWRLLSLALCLSAVSAANIETTLLVGVGEGDTDLSIVGLVDVGFNKGGALKIADALDPAKTDGPILIDTIEGDLVTLKAPLTKGFPPGALVTLFPPGSPEAAPPAPPKPLAPIGPSAPLTTTLAPGTKDLSASSGSYSLQSLNSGSLHTGSSASNPSASSASSSSGSTASGSWGSYLELWQWFLVIFCLCCCCGGGGGAAASMGGKGKKKKKQRPNSAQNPVPIAPANVPENVPQQTDPLLFPAAGGPQIMVPMNTMPPMPPPVPSYSMSPQYNTGMTYNPGSYAGLAAPATTSLATYNQGMPYGMAPPTVDLNQGMAYAMAPPMVPQGVPMATYAPAGYPSY